MTRDKRFRLFIQESTLDDARLVTTLLSTESSQVRNIGNVIHAEARRVSLLIYSMEPLGMLVYVEQDLSLSDRGFCLGLHQESNEIFAGNTPAKQTTVSATFIRHVEGRVSSSDAKYFNVIQILAKDRDCLNYADGSRAT